jgi:hypothetical protein
MQRVSVRERASHSLRPIPEYGRKPMLRVIEGGNGGLPIWQDLLGMLIFLLLHRKKKLEMVPTPAPDGDAFFDEVPNTGVHEIGAYRPDAVLTDDRLDEIIRDAEPVPKVRFHVSGEKPEKRTRQKKVSPQEEGEPLPKHVSAHALGQFVRAYLKARGRLGEYIDRCIANRIGHRKAALLDYKERNRMRRVERRAKADELLRIVREEGRKLRENEERLECGIDVIHIGRGPSNSYFVRFDPATGVVLGFYSAQGFNRHKAFRRARKKSYREGGRRFH